jgi:2-polyprenyl-3-methyl-5-hydroxy-6-metoxy-1,4-benzoquinol methylase
MARELKKKGCKTWGIEVDPAVAERARPHCEEVAVLDLDRSRAIPFEGSFFDAILLLDVLEHVIRPDLVLAELTKNLRPHGRIFASIPNIARVEYRLKLLFGKFEYEEGGIMSIGHLRFFTRATARRMIRECGLEILAERGTGFASVLKSKTGVEILPTLTAFQFLFECAKP